MNPGQLSWRERGWLWLRLGVRLVLFLAAVWLIAHFGRPLLSLFAPFLAALFAAALLNPMVKWMQRQLGWTRQGLTMILLLLLLLLLGGALVWLGRAAVNELVSLVNNWDALLKAGMEILEELDALFRRIVDMLPISIAAPDQGLMDWLLGLLPDSAPDLSHLTSYAGNKVVSISSFLLGVLFFVMATYFLTADYPYLRTRAIQNLDDGVLSFLDQIRATALGAFGGYLKAELLLSVGVFFILLAGFLIIRQPYGLLLALVLAMMDFIPIIGAGTVMVPWAVIALFTRDYQTAIEMMVIWGLIAMFRRVMEPKFVGDQTGLSPILSLISIYVGMRLAGVLGMILGPILLLVFLNLAGMGMFHGLKLDLIAAGKDLAAILSRQPGQK
ncbi:MAG: sporulation integral membrane protein YtvI [Lawsonibacter sp.]|jgi:sporulation integral membrane protein YtvI